MKIKRHSLDYLFQVRAFDAESRELDSSALVTLNLLDVNDNNPEFQRQQIIFSIPEGDYTRDPPRVLGEVEVMDLDMGLNGEIMINSFSEEENFIVLQNGTVLVHGVLDRETKDKYVISLLASDLGNPPRKNFAEALILIQDVNDNKPTFTQKEYFAHIPRNMNEGDPVITITATDLDIGYNSQISYRFSQDYTGFTIDEQTGQIFISSSLSAITPESVRPLLVIASDLGTPALSSSVNVFVTVATNNTGLQFLNSHYNFSVPEDRPAGTEVGIVKAIIGNRGTSLTYFLKTYLEKFSITNKGQIITRVMLDQESQNRYNVIVEATDSQEPPSTAATMVTVIVIDVNDNRPIFSPMVHSSVTCIENENFLDIGLISATDVDVGDNSIVTYSLENDFNGIFYINSSTGDLMTKKALDREVATSYDVTVVLLNISAMDRDTGYNALILYSFTRATPLFYIGHYSGSISNLQPLDYETAMEHVLKVIAYNPTDSQLRGTATVTDGNSEGLFVISNSTGHIFLIKDLPKHRTTVPYILTVKVMDSGVPPLSAFVKVYITIVPSNISFPVFSTDIYRPDPVSDKASPSTFLVQVYALYPTFLLYNITAGNDKDYFNMEPVTGVITTKMALQKEDFPRDITIMAVDPKNVSIFSQAQVHVSVKDDNSFTPVFPNPLVELTIKEEQPVPLLITQLWVFHNDTGRDGMITYSILSGDKEDFSINASNGKLYAEAMFDFEKGPIEYQIVLVAEHGSLTEQRKGYCTVVIHIIDINDWKPVFEPVENTMIGENAPVGTIVGKVTATDRDSGDNAFILYSLYDEGNQFKIDALLGNIFVSDHLDYETKKRSVLKVSATNNKTAPFYQTSKQIVIDILDENDNAPKFMQTQYYAELDVDSPAGTSIIVVTATDKDQCLGLALICIAMCRPARPPGPAPSPPPPPCLSPPASPPPPPPPPYGRPLNRLVTVSSNRSLPSPHPTDRGHT
ncbi:protocadherin Fat 4-like isoform X1 [Pelobates cultripes]|uniref:Protocadherin Fat 4-like isoform X1 n=1 Tax=Pelobates cultripes TaxID=61616 RepID=A0AAD1VW13_PELCU|nr:protocadherin Fat 4-like isoform X1 [Pelobates cultripes]